MRRFGYSVRRDARVSKNSATRSSLRLRLEGSGSQFRPGCSDFGCCFSCTPVRRPASATTVTRISPLRPPSRPPLWAEEERAHLRDMIRERRGPDGDTNEVRRGVGVAIAVEGVILNHQPTESQ